MRFDGVKRARLERLLDRLDPLCVPRFDHHLVRARLADAIDAPLDQGEDEQHNQHNACGNQHKLQRARADSHAQRGREPDRRGGGQAADLAMLADDRASAEKADARYDVCRDARLRKPRVYAQRKDGEQRRAEGDQNDGAKARGFILIFTLRADQPSNQNSHAKFDNVISEYWVHALILQQLL